MRRLAAALILAGLLSGCQVPVVKIGTAISAHALSKGGK